MLPTNSALPKPIGWPLVRCQTAIQLPAADEGVADPARIGQQRLSFPNGSSKMPLKERCWGRSIAEIWRYGAGVSGVQVGSRVHCL